MSFVPYNPLMPSRHSKANIVSMAVIAVAIHPFVAIRSEYNIVGRLPYLAAGFFGGIAGTFDPLGIRLLLVSTIPAAFGGSSGLLWLDSLMHRTTPDQLSSSIAAPPGGSPQQSPPWRTS